MSRHDSPSHPDDTRPAAHEVQIAIYRRLKPERRTAMAIEMSEEARAVTLQGIRERFPDWDDAQCRRELFRRILGDELADRVWGAEKA